MSLPTLSPEQRAAALEKALAVRQQRKAALDELTAGTTTLAVVLDDEASPLQRVKVQRVLTALPKVGPVTAGRVMAEVGIAESRRVGGLGVNQRRALAEHFAV